jgi:hypothetical protein
MRLSGLMVKEILDGGDDTLSWAEFKRVLDADNHRKEALEFVHTIREGGFSGHVKKPWFPSLYRHHLEFDISDLRNRPNGAAVWDFTNFRPKSTWFISASENVVVARFRKKEDLILFKLAVA